MNIKQSIKTIAIILAITIFCISCGKKKQSDNIEETINGYLEKVDEAKTIDEVQWYYNKMIVELNEFKSNHLKEMALNDSLVRVVNGEQQNFTYICCLKAKNLGGLIKDNNGVSLYVNDEDEVLPFDEMMASIDYKSCLLNDNPLGVIDIIPKFHDYTRFKKLTLKNIIGAIVYSNEDAEKYYEQYSKLLYVACVICGKGSDIPNPEITVYLERNFMKILQNLPLNERYPANVREYVNQQFFNCLDNIKKLSLESITNDYVYFYDGKTSVSFVRDTEDAGILAIY